MLYNTERPMIFDDMVGQKYIVENIRMQAIHKQFFGVYIFGGHFGCGKTTMARLFALAANCEHLDEKGNPCLQCKYCRAILSGSPDIIEVDAATNTGVDSVRELRETVVFRPLELKQKIYIIDEVHMLSKGAFNALLKVLEEPPSFVTFILCTTEINAIPATIRSRGACYFFEQLTNQELVYHIQKVAKKNEIVLCSGVANLIAKYSQGAARNALSILEQVSSTKKEVSVEMVQNLLGLSDNEKIFTFAKYLLLANTIEAVSMIEELEAKGKDFSLLCDDLIEIVTDAILFTIGGKSVLHNTEVYEDRIEMLVSITCADNLCILAEHLHEWKRELRSCPNKSMLLSFVLRLTMDTSNSVIALTKRIIALEKEVEAWRVSKNSFVISPTVYSSLEKNSCLSKRQKKKQNRLEKTSDSKDVDKKIIEEFDPFELLDFEESESKETRIAEQEPIIEKKPMVSSEEIQVAIRLIDRMAMEQPIFATVLKGCRIFEEEDGVHIVTELASLRNLVLFYCSCYEKNGNKAKIIV